MKFIAAMPLANPINNMDQVIHPETMAVVQESIRIQSGREH